MGRFLKTVSTSCWLSGSSWLIVIWPKQLNSTVFTETRTLNLQRTQVAQYYAPDRQRATEFQLEGFAWREAVITGAPPEVFLPGLPSDGWRVLPADLQVCPPIWRAGGRLSNTLTGSELSYNASAQLARLYNTSWQGYFVLCIFTMMQILYNVDTRSLLRCRFPHQHNKRCCNWFHDQLANSLEVAEHMETYRREHTIPLITKNFLGCRPPNFSDTWSLLAVTRYI